MHDRMMFPDSSSPIDQRSFSHTMWFHSFLVLLLTMAVLCLTASEVRCEGLHPEAFAGMVASRSGETLVLNVEPGVEFGRKEELWVYKKRDAIQIGGVTVKVNWVRTGRVRIDSITENTASAAILEEDSGSPIDVGDEVGRLPNTPPRIVSITSDAAEIKPKYEVNIYVKAEDDEGDSLHYSAQAGGGELLHPSDASPVLQWIAPEKAGAYEIAVRVSDEKGGVTDGKVTVNVLPLSEKDSYSIKSAIGGDSGAAWQYGAVTDIETDERDNLWVLDAKKNLVRRMSPTGIETGTVNLAEGRSASGVTPSNICLSDEGVIHILDTSHRSLERLEQGKDPITTVFDNSNRKVFMVDVPSDVYAIESGDVLVSDSAQGHIIMIDKDGRFLLLFAAQGTGPGDLLNPVSMAADQYGDIFILDPGKGEVLQFDHGFRFRKGYLCPMEGSTGKILADARTDSVFVLDGTVGSVRKLDADGQLKALVAPIAGGDSKGPSATSIAIRSSGHMLVGTDKASIWEFDSTGTLRGILGEENFGEVSSIAVTDNGDLFVLDAQAEQVKRFDRHRWLRARFGEKGVYEGQFQNPTRICVDGEGNSYVLDERRGCIQRFTSTGVFDKLLPIGSDVAGNLKDAVDMCITRDGTIYILDARRKSVFILSKDGGLLKIVPFTASGSRSGKQLKRPADVAVDESGIIYVSDPAEYVLHKFDAEGRRIETLGGKGKEAGQFGKMADLAVDGRGCVYVLVKDRQSVAKFDKDGRFLIEIPLAFDEVTPLKDPEVITVDSFGALYVYDGYYRAVFKCMQ